MMWRVWRREWAYLWREPWDFCLLMLAPLLVIVVFASMFYAGKAEHLPIAFVDQDQSQLSRTIYKHLSLNHTLDIALQTASMTEVEQAINRTDVWGYVLIPKGAEAKLAATQDPNIAIAFNQSYFSIGNSISTAMQVSTLEAMVEFVRNGYLRQNIPAVHAPMPSVKVSMLYNPDMSYEMFLEPFVVPAILHLLLCCCVAFAIGQEIKRGTTQAWLQAASLPQALLGKILVYVWVIWLWTVVWMVWLVGIRGWFVAGSLLVLLLGLWLFYLAYALIAAALVLLTQDMARTFGVLAVYGGSSMSFAGVTLPLNNAPWFTQFWSNIIPYTPYIRLQTEQWVVGSPVITSLPHLAVLLLYCLLFTWLSHKGMLRLRKKEGV